VLVWPAAETVTGTTSPGAMPDGTVTLTWYNPVDPGTRLADTTAAFCPPIETLTGFCGRYGGESGVMVPSGCTRAVNWHSRPPVFNDENLAAGHLRSRLTAAQARMVPALFRKVAKFKPASL
jgi:hypothetical protein